MVLDRSSTCVSYNRIESMAYWVRLESLSFVERNHRYRYGAVDLLVYVRSGTVILGCTFRYIKRAAELKRMRESGFHGACFVLWLQHFGWVCQGPRLYFHLFISLISKFDIFIYLFKSLYWKAVAFFMNYLKGSFAQLFVVLHFDGVKSILLDLEWGFR